jgi:hypothetical protein
VIPAAKAGFATYLRSLLAHVVVVTQHLFPGSIHISAMT